MIPPSAGANAPLDLSVIIVSWNVAALLRGCLASLYAGPGIAWEGADAAAGNLTGEIIVVDNASGDGTAAMVQQEFPHVRLIANPDNRGFTGGNNQGLAASRGRYVFFLNPDTVVQGAAIINLVRYLETHPRVGLVGPELRYGDGALQSSRRRFPTLGTGLFESTPLGWHWPRNPWARRYHMDDRPADVEQNVDWVVGAALMVRRKALDQVGGFDEGYFMYSEELDWCRRATRAGWQIVYLPAAQITHFEGRSSEQVVAARHIRFQRSKVRYFRKFHGPLAAEFLRAFILACFAAEWLLEAAKWLAGSKRPLRAARLSAYAALLRTRLAGKPG